MESDDSMECEEIDREDISDLLYKKMLTQNKKNKSKSKEENGKKKAPKNKRSSGNKPIDLSSYSDNHVHNDYEQNNEANEDTFKSFLRDVLETSADAPMNQKNKVYSTPERRRNTLLSANLRTEEYRSDNRDLNFSDLIEDDDPVINISNNNINSDRNDISDNTTSNSFLTAKSLWRGKELFELIIDTNFIIDNLPLINVLTKLQLKFLLRNRHFFKICIFDTVLSELDKLKQGNKRTNSEDNGKDDNQKELQELKFKAIKANDFIYKNLMETVDSNNPLGFQILHMVTKRELTKNEKMIKTKGHSKLFDEDVFVPATCNDDKILQSTLRLQNIIDSKSASDFDYIFFPGSNESNGEKFKILPTPILIVLSNDKNFCLKLLSNSIKTISLPQRGSNSSDDNLKNAKMITLKCIIIQIKSFLQDWQNMIKLNIFETLIKEQNCNTTILSIFDEILSYTINSDDMNVDYLRKTSSLFSVNNPNDGNLEDLLDSTPDMFFLFHLFLKYSSIFQEVLLKTLNMLNINIGNFDYYNHLLKIIFFQEADVEIESFLNRLTNIVLNNTEQKDNDDRTRLISDFSNYVTTLNDVSKIWETVFAVMAKTYERNFEIESFKIKLDFIWKDIVSLLDDVFLLANFGLKDLDNLGFR